MSIVKCIMSIVKCKIMIMLRFVTMLLSILEKNILSSRISSSMENSFKSIKKQVLEINVHKMGTLAVIGTNK